MKDNKLIIIEGPQGTGKSTLANYLRDTVASSNLYRLSGQKDKTATGKEISIKMYKALLDYLKTMQDIPMNMIFDRTFTTEEVYARLGYKDYSFTDAYIMLSDILASLDYDINYFSLYLRNTNLFEERLDRGPHHQYQAFSVENSVNQQNKYLEISDELDQYKSIKVHRIAMDNFDKSYDQIEKILKLK